MLDMPKKIGRPLGYEATEREIIEGFKRHGVDLIDYKIDSEKYNEYLKKADYALFPDYFGGGKSKRYPEKLLEHYLAAETLHLSKNDIFIDIAAFGSPAADIYKKIYGCSVYKQDLQFPFGLRKDEIGSDASAIPLPDNFATKMSLHCSFEHFRGDADIGFIKEAFRILKKNGKVCILPLYLFSEYAILTDPAIMQVKDLKAYRDAVVYCAKNWGNHFSRFYDVPHFIARVKNNLSGFNMKIYIIKNEKEINTTCYIKFILILEK